MKNISQHPASKVDHAVNTTPEFQLIKGNILTHFFNQEFNRDQIGFQHFMQDTANSNNRRDGDIGSYL